MRWDVAALLAFIGAGWAFAIGVFVIGYRVFFRLTETDS